MVRLVGGPSIKEGRVEYCNSGIWHSLCGNVWEDEQEARVLWDMTLILVRENGIKVNVAVYKELFLELASGHVIIVARVH